MRRSVRFSFVVICSLVAGWMLLGLAAPIRIYEGKGYSRLVFDRNSQLLDMRIAPDGRYRSPVSLKDVSPHCIRAALQFEDRYFFRHPGVNPFSLARALFSTFGPKRIGGSTITMQLVRLRLGLNTKDIFGKLRQMREALVLERHLTKNEILEGYFNFAPYGGGIEGIAAASAIYFGTTPDKLSAAQCAALAVIPQAPTERFGFRTAGFRAAYLRLVGELKIPNGESSINLPEGRLLDPPHLARHLATRVLSSGGSVMTTIDRQLQQQLEGVVSGYITSRSNFGLRNAALLVADGSSGEVLTYIGSRDYTDPNISGFVDGISSKRSPGSVLKPFIYGRAIDEGVIVPESVIADIAVKLTAYEPENFERNFLGLISAREALVKSRNIPALLLNAQLRDEGLYSLLQRAGVPLKRDAEYYGSAVVLGGIELSLWDVVRLYTAFVARGQAIPLRATIRPSADAPIAVFSPESAYLTRQMLKTNPPPSGYSPREVAWKTGTSSGGRDAWAVGVAGTIVVGVWLGNFDNTPNANFIGRDLAGPLLFEVLERIRNVPRYAAATRIEAGAAGLNLTFTTICPESGQLHSPHCTHSKRALMIPGISPIRTCTVHRDGAMGSPVHNSEVRAHFASIGLQLGTQERTSTRSVKSPPRIVSPEEGIEYRVEYGKEPELELRANVDGEARRVFWYVDGAMVGDTEPGKSLFWPATVGNVTIRVIDSFGASDAVRVKIVAQEG